VRLEYNLPALRFVQVQIIAGSPRLDMSQFSTRVTVVRRDYQVSVIRILNDDIVFIVFFFHGNKGQSGVNLNDTIRPADPENPQFGANSVHVSLKVPELWLLEVAIGRNAIFQIFW